MRKRARKLFRDEDGGCMREDCEVLGGEEFMPLIFSFYIIIRKLEGYKKKIREQP